MTTEKQIQMVMRDMLYINWAVEPDVVRKLVDPRLEIDTAKDRDGRELSFISAVCFNVTELRTGILPVPNLSFQQINYRTYVRSGDVPAVFFFELKINSRMVTALTSFMSVPVHYEDIEINTVDQGPQVLAYRVQSNGLQAETVIDQHIEEPGTDYEIPHEFITQRFLGFARAGNGMFKLDVEQNGLDSVSAKVQQVRAPGLERLGLLTVDQSKQPSSAFYVSEAIFGANAPARAW